MNVFISIMRVSDRQRVLDLGGTTEFWIECPRALDLTIVNLPGQISPAPPSTKHMIKVIEADACKLPALPDKSFDIVFSNAVIEHVGDFTKRLEFAKEVRRLAPLYWVQTPSIWFPIESHNHMPFWWFYPERARRFFIDRWRQKLPAWAEMVAQTTVIRQDELRELFSDGTLIVERSFLIPKSYIVYKSA